MASVEIAAPPERVFQALTSKEVCNWWVRPGVFDTRQWDGDVRVGGRWTASGVGNGRPYEIGGEFLVVDPPRRLVHTWERVGIPGGPTTVAYHLEPIGRGTRLTLRHSGFGLAAVCDAAGIGWEISFERLAELLKMPIAGHGL